MSKFYFYNSYGLNIKSTIPFPELITVFEKLNDPDVLIHFEDYESFSNEKYGTGLTTIPQNFNEVNFLWDSKPLFKVKDGKEIIINLKTDLNRVFLRSLVLGRGMGTLLHQRGYLVLHASAVNMGSGAVAFLGWRGHGKSTTTVALNNSGYPLVADDVLTVETDGNSIPTVFPSFPRIKLRQDVIEHITDDPDPIPKIHPDIEKRSYYVENNFSLNPLPLKRVYILDKSEENKITTLNVQEAIIDLIKHSYCVSIFEKSEQSRNLLQCADLIKNVPVKRLETQQSIEKLNDLVKTIKEDIFSLD